MRTQRGRREWIGALAVVLAACAAPAPSPDSSAAGRSPGATTSAELASPSAASTPDAADDGWELMAEAPFERIEMAVAAHDGAIWVVGGLLGSGGASDETWRFDPAAESWEEGPAVPYSVHHAALVSTVDGLLLVGGYQGASFNSPTASVLRLSDDGSAWQEAVALPQPRAAGGAAWDGSRLVYAGGVGPGGAVAADVLALEGDAWRRIGAMASPREHVSATSDDQGRVWILGGRTITLTSNLATVEVVEGDLVARLGVLPTPRGGATAFHHPAAGACLVGGEEPSRAIDAVECMAPDGTVTELPTLAAPVHGHGSAVLDGYVYVLFGGLEPLLTVSPTVQRLEIAAGD